MESDNSITDITCLPNEILTLILTNNEPQEIMRFSVTCKQFYDTVINNDYLWKIKYSEMMPKEIVKVVEEQCTSSTSIWLKEIAQYNKLKQKIFCEVISMSPKSYWRFNEVSLEDVRIFFSFATETNLSFYYTINILQNIVKKTNEYLDRFTISKPLYTLTELYYTKIILRHLMQTYLAIKWVQMHMKELLTPEVVITFFVQWIDPTVLYSDEEVEDKIQSLVEKVENILKERSKKSREKERYSDQQILLAIKQVIYNRENFSISPNTKVNTLNIAKVIDGSHGSIIAYAVIFQAVAQRFGVNCELIAFPNHLFLEWQDNEDPNRPLYTIDLITGDVKPKRRCPFYQSNTQNEYFPDSLLQYVYSSYMKSKGAVRDCKTQNAIHLLDFLETRQIHHNPYKNFLSYLVEHADYVLSATFDMKYIDDEHLQMILALSNLNDSSNTGYHQVSVKNHPSSVTYGVGMLCYHKVFNYMCIVRGWDTDGSRLRIPADDNLLFGREQPFYRVIAGDQSERFVAQENLLAVTAPFRIHRLEDHIAKEFTHFDGFCYVLNNEKSLEYPDEKQVVDTFKKRYFKVGFA